MTQIVITLEDKSYATNIRRIVKSLRGVSKVSLRTDSEVSLGTNHLKLNARASELMQLCDGWDGSGSKAISPKLIFKFKEQIAKIDNDMLDNWVLFPDAHGYLYLDYTHGETLAGITMTEKHLTYFIKKHGHIEKGNNRNFTNPNLKSIFKKVYE